MKIAYRQFGALVCLASAIFALAGGPGLRAQSVDPEFQKARQARNEAIRTGDQATFERYTAENFLAIGPTGVVENKGAARRAGEPGAAAERRHRGRKDHAIRQQWAPAGAV